MNKIYKPTKNDIFISTVSENTILSANKFSKKYKRNIILISSLNQVSTYKKSYLFKDYSELKKKISNLKNNYLYLGRDHFGTNSIKNFKLSNNYNFLLKNIKVDINNNLNFVHFDMAKDNKYLFFFNKYLPIILKLNKNLIIEIGLDQDGDKTNNKNFKILNNLMKIYPNNIRFITFQTGTKLFNNSNVSKVEYKKIDQIIGKSKNIFFKEHNSDFKNRFHFKKLKKLNFVYNIGPEFAYYENKFFMNEAKKIIESKKINNFYKMILDSKLWSKWCNKSLSNKEKLFSSLHYFNKSKQYKEIIKQLNNRIHFDNIVINNNVKLLEKKFLF